MAIVAANEEIVRSRAHAAQLIALATSALEQTVLIGVPTDIKD